VKKTNLLLVLGASSILAFACSSDGGDAPPTGQAGGTSVSGGSNAGTPAVGGGGAAAGASGGAGSSGSNVGGGGSGGAPVGGAGGGGVAGSAGANLGGGGGAGGTGGAGGSGGGSATTKPSAGCSKSPPRPAGGVVTVAQNYYLTFPESYDGKQPLPVLIGFHGCGGVNRGTTKDDTEWIRLTKGSDFETDYVRAVPLSSDTGGCWNYSKDMPRVTAMYDELVQNHCVDTGRVFGTGHSSGAQLVVQILLSSHTADAKHLGFKGIAPVAASDYGPMTGPIPVMYIQGKMDAERNNGDGHETVARLRAANSCMDASTPYAAVMGCQSGNTSVNPGCVSYQGCSAPTIWCSHNDPAYSGTMHGVPCFGVKAMHDFFESLP
jgi:hypothetical protein